MKALGFQPGTARAGEGAGHHTEPHPCCVDRPRLSLDIARASRNQRRGSRARLCAWRVWFRGSRVGAHGSRITCESSRACARGSFVIFRNSRASLLESSVAFPGCRGTGSGSRERDSINV